MLWDDARSYSLKAEFRRSSRNAALASLDRTFAETPSQIGRRNQTPTNPDLNRSSRMPFLRREDLYYIHDRTMEDSRSRPGPV